MHAPISVLVVANVTADSPELIDALRARLHDGPDHFTLVMPCMGPGLQGRDVARPRLDAALAAWRDAGIDADGVVGDEDPVEAVLEHWDPRRHDEIIVSTLPGLQSRWMRTDLPSRLMRATDAPRVTHVSSSAAAAAR
jgi:hypothetical protein